MTIYTETITLSVDSEAAPSGSVTIPASISLDVDSFLTESEELDMTISDTFFCDTGFSVSIFEIGLYYVHEATNFSVSVEPRENYGWKNTSGTPITAIRKMSKTEQGYIDPIPGDYNLTLAQAQQDGAVPGVELIDVTGSAGDTATVEPGGFWDVSASAFNNYLYGSNVPTGVATTSYYIVLKNKSSVVLTDNSISLVNRAILTQTSFGTPFYSLFQRYGYFPLVTDSVAITFVESSGVAQILINGLGSNVVDDEGTVYVEGQGLLCDDKTAYTFDSGTILEGLSFILANNVSSSSTATIEIQQNVWEISLNGTDWQDVELDLSDLDPDEEVNIYFRSNPYSSLAFEDTNGLLQITTSLADISVPLRATLVEAQGVDYLDNTLFLRCAVVSAEMEDNLFEFGITEAS
jgi:hypothetical protein